MMNTTKTRNVEEDMKMVNSIDLVVQSLYDPGSQLWLRAKRENCYDELMKVREHMLDYLESLREHYLL